MKEKKDVMSVKYVGVTLKFTTLNSNCVTLSFNGVIRSFNGTDYMNIFKFDEDDLGPLDDVKIGQLVLVDTGRGFYVGRIVKKLSGGFNSALNAGMNGEDVTREVIDLLYDRDTLVEKLEAEKEEV